jgi:predicted RNA-binding protein
MCEARVYLGNGSEEKEIMQDVVRVEPDGDTMVCVSLLGERKLVRGTLRKVDFLKHTVHLSLPSETAGIES